MGGDNATGDETKARALLEGFTPLSLVDKSNRRAAGWWGLREGGGAERAGWSGRSGEWATGIVSAAARAWSMGSKQANMTGSIVARV